MPFSFTCTLSNDESTNRAVPGAGHFFAQYMPGLNTHADFHINILDTHRSVMRKTKFKKWFEPIDVKRIPGIVEIIPLHRNILLPHNAATKIYHTKLVPHLTSLCLYGFFQKAAINARISNICNKLICLCGGISKAGILKYPSVPMKNRENIIYQYKIRNGAYCR